MYSSFLRKFTNWLLAFKSLAYNSLLLNDMLRKNNELESRLEALELNGNATNELDSCMKALELKGNATADYCENEINKLNSKLFDSMEIPFALECQYPKLISNAEKRLTNDLGGARSYDDDLEFYSLFSELGGDEGRNIIRKQHDYYLKYITMQNGGEFLDIGCGAGEFIEFLRENGIKSCGIDVNEIEVKRACLKGLNASCVDVFDYLRKTNNKFIGISLLQVIEHLPSDAIPGLIKSIYGKLERGGVLMIETINLSHDGAFNSFYVDPTHIRPVSQIYLGFLLEFCGFQEIKLIYTLPVSNPSLDKDNAAKNYFNYTLVAYK